MNSNNNMVELHSGFAINGNVQASGTGNVLSLGRHDRRYIRRRATRKSYYRFYRIGEKRHIHLDARYGACEHKGKNTARLQRKWRQEKDRISFLDAISDLRQCLWNE